MRGGGEPGHVHADLGDDGLGGPLPGPGDGVEPVTGTSVRDTGLAGVRREQGVDALVEPGDRLPGAGAIVGQDGIGGSHRPLLVEEAFLGQGGGPAALNAFVHETDEGWQVPPMVSKMRGITLARGERVRLETPGGGGWGDAPAAPTPDLPPEQARAYAALSAPATLDDLQRIVDVIDPRNRDDRPI